MRVLRLQKKVELHTAGGTPLTGLGRRQARIIAEKLKHIHFDAIFSSDLHRDEGNS